MSVVIGLDPTAANQDAERMKFTGHERDLNGAAGTPSNTMKYLDYDPFGRPRKIQPSDGAGHEVTITRSGVRSVTKKTKVWGPCGPGGALQECSSETRESYDKVGRLFRIDQPVSWPTATILDPAPLRTSYAYDIGDRLKTVKQFDAATLAIIQQREFAYDNRGFLTSERHPEKGAAGNGLVTYSKYDARGHAGRKVDGASDLTFEYDKAERMTKVRETGTSVGFGTTAGTAFGRSKSLLFKPTVPLRRILLSLRLTLQVERLS